MCSASIPGQSSTTVNTGNSISCDASNSLRMRVQECFIPSLVCTHRVELRSFATSPGPSSGGAEVAITRKVVRLTYLIQRLILNARAENHDVWGSTLYVQ